jgi:hypothetical protein
VEEGRTVSNDCDVDAQLRSFWVMQYQIVHMLQNLFPAYTVEDHGIWSEAGYKGGLSDILFGIVDDLSISLFLAGLSVPCSITFP